MEILVYVLGLALVASGIWVGRILFGHYVLAEHPSRFPRMAGILGLSVDGLRDSDVGMHVPTAERLCLACKDTDVCDEWLASGGDPDEAPDFCPNAGYLHLARRPLDTLD